MFGYFSQGQAAMLTGQYTATQKAPQTGSHQ